MSLEEAFSSPAKLMEIDGVQVPASFSGLDSELHAIRSSVGLSALDHVGCLRLSGQDMWDVLDRICAADLYLRDLQLRHTLLLDDAGRPIVDVYVGNDDDSFVLLAEGMPNAALMEHIRSHAPTGASYELVDLRSTHTLLGLTGPFAWEAMAALEGPDIIGFPYLTFYHPREGSTYFRAGKTGEYGYDLLVPRAEAASLWRAFLDAGKSLDLAEVGAHALWHASLENWFFNIRGEGRFGLSPIELQLQWRLATDDKDYVGRQALRQRTVRQRITALVARDALQPGDDVSYGGQCIGSVLVAARSVTLGCYIALALVDLSFSYSHIDRFLAGDVAVHTVSPPFVNNLSLYVNPQQHTFATRHEIPFPGPWRRHFVPAWQGRE